MYKDLLPLKLLVDADDWPFLGKTKLMFYIFCLPLFRKRSHGTGTDILVGPLVWAARSVL